MLFLHCRLNNEYLIYVQLTLTLAKVCPYSHLITQNSEKETTFVKNVISIFKNLETSNIIDKDNLENIVSHIKTSINQT